MNIFKARRERKNIEAIIEYGLWPTAEGLRAQKNTELDTQGQELLNIDKIKSIEDEVGQKIDSTLIYLNELKNYKVSGKKI